MMPGALQALAPSLEFPLTLCLVSYGANPQLVRRLLESFEKFSDTSLFSLRVGLNAVCSETEKVVREFQRKNGKVYVSTSRKNIFKIPMMRRLLHERRVETAWTIWCDDDTYFTRADWLHRLALKIEGAPNIDMWGWMHVVWITENETLDWMRRAPWYRRRPFHKGTDLEGRRAVELRFATGGFWAIKTEVLYKLDWPDPRLVQGGDDFILGEALHQNGCKIGNFKHGVAISAAERRNPSAPEHSFIP
jgi:hypothetical protein